VRMIAVVEVSGNHGMVDAAVDLSVVRLRGKGT
jgi:hypothetical protein